MEVDYDFLWIYDGDDVYAPTIGRWNTQSPGMVESSSNVMCVEFRSDCQITASGWEASWVAVSTNPNDSVAPEEPVTEVSVTPNPTTGKFKIQSHSDGFTDVVVYDVHGNQMIPITRFVESKEFDASGWPAGVYVVHFGHPVTMGHVVKLVKVSTPQ